tara:strand:- start:1710 stop:2057 length:348 start_codon:yes stop_codon:yes gene_type:complete
MSGLEKPSDSMVREWKCEVKRHGDRWDDEDEAFDEAFDFVMNHDDAPMDDDDPEELDVELARKWTYQLLEQVGKPYSSVTLFPCLSDPRVYYSERGRDMWKSSLKRANRPEGEKR